MIIGRWGTGKDPSRPGRVVLYRQVGGVPSRPREEGPMRWECMECGGEIERARKPSACSECGTAALFVRAAEAAQGAALGPQDLRESWLELGLHWAAEGAPASL
jgi:DNA-directed RNA polymerase subunit RPC12/RpoP